MSDLSHPAGPLSRWRAERARSARNRRAVRAEFELERPHGLAALRALARSVGELEGERIRSHALPARRSVPSAGADARVRAGLR